MAIKIAFADRDVLLEQLLEQAWRQQAPKGLLAGASGQGVRRRARRR